MVQPVPSLILRTGLLAGSVILIALLTSSLWLSALGKALIHDDGPARAEIGVVLAGDFFGHRLEKAAELVKKGYIPSVLVSGPPGIYGTNEADLEVAFIEREGYPASWFIPFPDRATSTRQEALAVLQELRRRNIHSFLLITSDYHSARATRIFRAAARRTGYQPQMRTVISPDEYFRPDSWWRTRDGQKTVFFEWSKTIATALGD